jgi:hypothetical protein
MIRGPRADVILRPAAVAILLLVPAHTAFGQTYPFPTQVGFGFSLLADQRLPELDATLAFDLSFADWQDRDGDSRIDGGLELVFRAELGPTSDAVPCQVDPSVEFPSNCSDTALLGGARYRFGRDPTRRPWLFASLLLGEYSRASGPGAENSSHFVMEGGAGIEIRLRPDSIQGLRFSTDVRHVFGTGRNQFRLTCFYFLGFRLET